MGLRQTGRRNRSCVPESGSREKQAQSERRLEHVGHRQLAVDAQSTNCAVTAQCLTWVTTASWRARASAPLNIARLLSTRARVPSDQTCSGSNALLLAEVEPLAVPTY